jgi:hypothetical protein
LKNSQIYHQDKELAVYLEAIVEAAIDAIITIDERGIVERVNPATERLFGYTEKELIGFNVSKLMTDRDRDSHDQYIERYLETRHPHVIGIGREVVGRNKDGTHFPLRLAVSETIINGKRIFIGILHDLTEMKKAEAEIRKLNEELEQKVQFRTEELAEAINKLLNINQKLLYEVNERKIVAEALRKSEKELRKALDKEKELNQLKSRFVSMASHEFRTPLSAILSSADLIEAYTANSPEDKRMKHVQRIKTAVNSLIGVLNDFLSLSKLEEDKVRLDIVDFTLPEFCKELLDEMRGLLKPGQVIRHPEEIPDERITMDKKILKNILYNLVSNAIKYSEPGSPIDCTLKIIDHTLHLTLKDQGIGIPEEDQQHMFSQFFRAHNVENIQGTGLGLNIVKRYVDLLDGEISFESILGRGTTFFVKIPCQFPISSA